MSRSKRRSRGSRNQPELVDLPLTAPEPQPPEAEAAPEDVENLPLFPDLGERAAVTLHEGDGEHPLHRSAGLEGGEHGEEEDDDEGWGHADEVVTPAPSRATAPRRLLGVLADLVIHLAVLAGGVTAMALLGLEPRLEDLPGLAIYLLSFSFLYTVVPLAFWGQTAGMAWAGIRAMDHGHHPLTFGQTAMRWLAGLLCVALAGLPLLLSFTRRSFADRLSGSETWQNLDSATGSEQGPGGMTDG